MKKLALVLLLLACAPAQAPNLPPDAAPVKPVVERPQPPPEREKCPKDDQVLRDVRDTTLACLFAEERPRAASVTFKQADPYEPDTCYAQGKMKPGGGRLRRAYLAYREVRGFWRLVWSRCLLE
jgi:hypothetical protein